MFKVVKVSNAPTPERKSQKVNRSRRFFGAQSNNNTSVTPSWVGYSGSPGTNPITGTGGAISTEGVCSGESEFCFDVASTAPANRIMIGFTKNLNSSTTWTRLDWAVYLYNGQIRVYGRSNPTTGSSSYIAILGTYSVGDKMAMCTDSSGNVILKQNGSVIYTFTNQIAGYPIYPGFYAWGGNAVINETLSGSDLC